MISARAAGVEPHWPEIFDGSEIDHSSHHGIDRSRQSFGVFTCHTQGRQPRGCKRGRNVWVKQVVKSQSKLCRRRLLTLHHL
jgi:hypothetical protein